MGPSSLQASCKLFGNYANYSFWGIYLVALPGLEPGLFALRGRRVNQLHHNAMNGWGIRCDFVSIAKMGWRRNRGYRHPRLIFVALRTKYRGLSTAACGLRSR